MSARTVRFMCVACNGTGRSRWYEGRDCDQCNGFGTIASTLTTTRVLDAPDELQRRADEIYTADRAEDVNRGV